jgi:hypothetical protein
MQVRVQKVFMKPCAAVMSAVRLHFPSGGWSGLIAVLGVLEKVIVKLKN